MRRCLSTGRPRNRSATREFDPSAPIKSRARIRSLELPSMAVTVTPSLSSSIAEARQPSRMLTPVARAASTIHPSSSRRGMTRPNAGKPATRGIGLVWSIVPPMATAARWTTFVAA